METSEVPTTSTVLQADALILSSEQLFKDFKH